MTFKEILDNILLDIDEEPGDTILENKIKKFINRAYKELSKREDLRKVANKSILSGVCRIPSDCNSIYTVKLEGSLINFKIEGRNICYNTDGNIEINYSYIPADLEDNDDTPITNLANEEFIISYAKYLYFLSDMQVDLAKLYKIDSDSFRVIINSNNYEIINVYGGI